jgi:putative transposase
MLRSVVRAVRASHPLEIVAMVVLPEHLHCIWQLPGGDADYPTRWSLIKAGFSRRLGKNEFIRASRRRKRERGIWQRRYWEHQIRDNLDLQRHVDYIQLNMDVDRPAAWRYASLHRHIKLGWLSAEWEIGLIDGIGNYGE